MLTRWRTPLYAAAQGGHLEVVQNGRTPLWIAASRGHLKVVQALEKAGAKMDALDRVRGGRGGDVGRTNGVCVSFWGLQNGC